MGSSASKASTGAREAVQRGSSAAAAQAGAQAAKAAPQAAAAAAAGPAQRKMTPRPYASESKDQAIMDDGSDPVAQNLGALGQARVQQPDFRRMPRGRTRAAPNNAMAGILQQRAASEAVFESGTLGANQMSARSLSILFDECKGAKSMEDVERLAHEFGVDFEVLKELARHFNSPSVEMVKEGNAANGEQDTMLAKWQGPLPTDSSSASARIPGSSS